MNQRPPIPRDSADPTLPGPTLPGPVAYLTGEYPKVSHTFIQREIAELRARGVTVLACTVRRPPAKEVVGDGQQAEAARTFHVLETAKAPHRLIGAHLWALARSPRRWLQTLALAWRTRPPGLKAALWQLFYFLESAVLARHLHRNGAVHLHNHFANSSCSVAMLTSRMSGIPYSFTLHGPAIFFEPMHWRLDEKIALARHVFCISHFARSQAMLFSDRKHWNKLRIVHCGVDPARYGTAPRDGYGKRLVFVGRLAAVKGVPLLLEAFARARARHPEAHLTVVGDGPDRAELEDQARTLGIADAVRFAGYQPQEAVPGFLDSADALVLPSFAEGVPVVLMEAMASRLPVIATRVAGVAELVEDGVSGFVVAPGDLDALSDRIERLLSDSQQCAHMGAAGRAMVAAEFDIGKEAARIIAILAGDPGRRAPAESPR